MTTLLERPTNMNPEVAVFGVSGSQRKRAIQIVSDNNLSNVGTSQQMYSFRVVLVEKGVEK